MASDVTFTVTDPLAPRLAVDPEIEALAEHLREDVAALTPRLTGRLAESWHITRDGIAEYIISSDVPYARFVEFGTRYDPAAAPLGRALARARGRR